jgi:hypothetical protein
MKNKKLQLLATLLIATALLHFNGCACKKQILGPDGLPPITDTGANTFGCMVNGKLFVPDGKGFYGLTGMVPLICAYDILDGRHNLFLSGAIRTATTISSVYLGCDSLALIEGQTYILKLDSMGNASAGYRHSLRNSDGSGTINTYSTANDTNLTGKLTITHLDKFQRIISGTFWFNAVNDQNPYDTVKITQGRFDMKF